MASNPLYPVTEDFLKKNPGASGHIYADLLSLLPLILLTVLLYAVGREWLFAPRGGDTPPAAPTRGRAT